MFKINYQEIKKDLFTVDDKYYLAHCISSDCKLGAGIAVEFQKRFNLRSKFLQMDLIDLMEMMCDWKAATLRHNDGDINKSLEINQKRFGYSDELKEIMKNSLKYF